MFCDNTNESHKKLLMESLINPFTRTTDTKVGRDNGLYKYVFIFLIVVHVSLFFWLRYDIIKYVHV